MSLNLRRALPASPGGRSTSSEEMVSSCDLKSFQDACNRKLKIASALCLLPQDPPSSVETAETFHTAAADSPELRSLFPETAAFLTRRKSETRLERVTKEKLPDDEKRDADTCLESKVDEKIVDPVDQSAAPPLKHPANDRPFDSPIDDQCRDSNCDGDSKNGVESDSGAPSETSSLRNRIDSQETLAVDDDNLIRDNQTMKRLNQRIARQRMHVMRCLEASTPSKDDLNRQISILQDLQKQQIELEVSLLEKEKNCLQDRVAGSGVDTAADYSDVESADAGRWNSGASGTNASSVSIVATARPQMTSRGTLSDPDEEVPRNRPVASRASPSRGYSSVYLTVSVPLFFRDFIKVSDSIGV